jgi:hypothetical protein
VIPKIPIFIFGIFDANLPSRIKAVPSTSSEMGERSAEEIRMHQMSFVAGLYSGGQARDGQ